MLCEEEETSHFIMISVMRFKWSYNDPQDIDTMQPFDLSFRIVCNALSYGDKTQIYVSF